MMAASDGSIATVGSFWDRRPVLHASVVSSLVPSYRRYVPAVSSTVTRVFGATPGLPAILECRPVVPWAWLAPATMSATAASDANSRSFIPTSRPLSIEPEFLAAAGSGRAGRVRNLPYGRMVVKRSAGGRPPGHPGGPAYTRSR